MPERRFAATLTREESFAFEVAFDQDPTPAFTLDEPEPLGTGRGPNATRLLGAAIGHCLSASLLFCFEKSRIPVHGMVTSVRGTVVRNEAGRLRIGEIDVELAPGLAPEDRDRISRCLELFEDFCIVTGSVRAGVEVNVRVAPTFGAVPTAS